MADEPKLKEYVLISPDGRTLRVPGFLFEALTEFVENRRTGHIEVHFRDGGFASADSVAKKSYRNGSHP